MSTAVTKPSLPVSSRLLQDLRLSGPVTGDSELVALNDPREKTELLAVGAAGEIFNIRHSDDDTGWMQTNLKNGFPSSHLAIGQQNETVYAFAAGIDESNPEIHKSSRTGNTPWTSWEQLPVANANLSSNQSVIRLVAALIGGHIELFAFLQTGPGSPDFAISLWWVPWQASDKPWVNLGPASRSA